MPFTTIQQNRIDLFRTSVRLQNPLVEPDPAYKFTDADLWNILSLVTPVYSIRYTIDSIPDNEFYFPLLLAKKEIYFRLATSTAPFYPLEAEGAKLNKNVRFDHYMSLIRLVEKDYITAKNEFINGDGVIRSYDVKALARYFSLRNFNLAERPIISGSLSNITQTTVNVDWTKFDASNGAMFFSYKVFVTTASIIDEYAYLPAVYNIPATMMSYDIHRLKYRVTDLLAGTNYFCTIVAVDRNSLYGWIELPFTTLP